MTDPHLDDHSDDIPQSPFYDGPDWDGGDDIPMASCVARTPDVTADMAAHDSQHAIQES